VKRRKSAPSRSSIDRKEKEIPFSYLKEGFRSLFKRRRGGEGEKERSLLQTDKQKRGRKTLYSLIIVLFQSRNVIVWGEGGRKERRRKLSPDLPQG